MARRNLFEELTDLQLIERYRFDRDGLLYLEAQLNHVLAPRTARNHSISCMEKILITLRFMASGQIQLNDADIHDISQPTVSRIIGEVISSMSHPNFVSRYIRFPVNPLQINQTKLDFSQRAHFPNVIGVIDGTRIQIQRPSLEEAAYVNRMGYHSINTQIVFDSQDVIIDLVARWPGSTHDSRILRESGLWRVMENGDMGPGEHFLLGDSGYPCKRWLLTPYRNPAPGSQTTYNRSHKSTRSHVERGIGQLKSRWGILRGEIRLNPIKVCKVILTCAVLHNLCKVRNIPLPEDLFVENDNEDVNEDQQPVIQDGLRFRDYVANTYF